MNNKLEVYIYSFGIISYNEIFGAVFKKILIIYYEKIYKL
jgi:hypothetical protein